MFVPAVRIWGVVFIAAVLVWVLVVRGFRSFLPVLLASMASCAAVILPFFLASPSRMWDMVVAAQLGRPDMTTTTIEDRLWAMLGVYGSPASSQLAHTFAGVAWSSRSSPSGAIERSRWLGWVSGCSFRRRGCS
ncbi:MAG TPA: hypothetical protein VGK53_24800 [Propionicimonas sp.]